MEPDKIPQTLSDGRRATRRSVGMTTASCLAICDHPLAERDLTELCEFEVFLKMCSTFLFTRENSKISCFQHPGSEIFSSRF